MPRLRIEYPTHLQPRSVTFGSGCAASLADLPDLTHTLFFVSGSSAVRERLSARLARRGADWDALASIEKPAGEPTLEMVEQGAARITPQTRRLVAVGGGAVLDWVRLAWAHSRGWLGAEGPAEALRDAPRAAPELLLVPTTCSTGAEATRTAVLAGKGGSQPLVATGFMADRVLLDASFLADLEPNHVSLLLCDALSHAVEAYASIVPGRLAGAASVSALQTILAWEGAAPGSSRSERLLEAAHLAGVAVGNCGAGLVHAFAHSAAPYGISHAQGNALALVAGIETNAESPALEELARHAGFETSAELAEAVAPIVRRGLAHARPDAAREMLRDASLRERIGAAIAADASLRTNPLRLNAAQIGRFVDRVRATAESA